MKGAGCSVSVLQDGSFSLFPECPQLAGERAPGCSTGSHLRPARRPRAAGQARRSSAPIASRS